MLSAAKINVSSVAIELLIVSSLLPNLLIFASTIVVWEEVSNNGSVVTSGVSTSSRPPGVCSKIFFRFWVMSEFAEFAYKCDDFYHPEDEGGLAWNDPDLNIAWPDVGEILLSEKDKKNPCLCDANIQFVL